MATVHHWLESLGLDVYTDAFRQHAIEWETLPELNHELLKEVGIKVVGHRIALLRAIRALDLETQEIDPRSLNPLTVDGSQHASARQAERRQLTVMFCDLVGSSALSTELDPEDLRELIASFQDACKKAIDQFDGFIARYMGDGMLVYFGYPQAHEDDGKRAVLAGLAIVASIDALRAGICVTTPNYFCLLASAHGE